MVDEREAVLEKRGFTYRFRADVQFEIRINTYGGIQCSFNHAQPLLVGRNPCLLSFGPRLNVTDQISRHTRFNKDGINTQPIFWREISFPTEPTIRE